MYTLRFCKSHLGIMVVDLSHQEPTRTVRSPFKAYVPGEVTPVSRMSNVQSKLLEKSPRYRDIPFCTKNPLELRGAHSKLKFLEKSSRYRGGPMYTLSSWRSHLGIVVFQLLRLESTRTVGALLKA